MQPIDPNFNSPRGPQHGSRRGQYEQVCITRRDTRLSLCDAGPDTQRQFIPRQAADAAPDIEHAEDEGLFDGNTSEPDANKRFDHRHYIDGLPEVPGAAPSVSAAYRPQTTTTIQQPSAVTSGPTLRSSRRGGLPRRRGRGQSKWFVWSPGRGKRPMEWNM